MQPLGQIGKQRPSGDPERPSAVNGRTIVPAMHSGRSMTTGEKPSTGSRGAADEQRPARFPRGLPAGRLYDLRRDRAGRPDRRRDLQRRSPRRHGALDRAAQPHCGVYFTVNATPPHLRKKALKEDITAIAGFWSDLDPRDDQGLPIDHERERLAALAEELLALDTPPTLIIDSGNGLQPIWLLADPIEASPEYRDAADALCARFEAALGAKGTHNCDRVLRVPGTINHPNRKKRNLGRGETQARLLAATWQRYGWRDLEQLAARLENDPPAHAVPIVVDQRAGPRTGLRPEELDELRRSLTGDNPSGWLIAMLKMIGRLVREGASDWFIKDWALQYRWPEYTETQTLREIEPMIRGARKKGFDQKWDDQPSAAARMVPRLGPSWRRALDLSHDGLALDMGKRWARNGSARRLVGKVVVLVRLTLAGRREAPPHDPDPRLPAQAGR